MHSAWTYRQIGTSKRLYFYNMNFQLPCRHVRDLFFRRFDLLCPLVGLLIYFIEKLWTKSSPDAIYVSLQFGSVLGEIMPTDFCVQNLDRLERKTKRRGRRRGRHVKREWRNEKWRESERERE